MPEVTGLNVVIGADMQQLVSVMRQSMTALDEFKSHIEGTMRSTVTATQRADDTVKAFGNSIRSMGTNLTTVGTSLSVGLTAPLVAMAKYAVDAQSTFENATIGLTTMMGSAEAAKSMVNDLAQFAARTPFDFKGTLKASQQLMAMGFSAGEVLPVLRNITDYLSAMGKFDQGSIQRITYAFGKIREGGYLTMEPLRQLLRNGLPVLDMLATKYDTTTFQLRKMIKQGLIPTQEALDVIFDQIQKKFGGNTERLMQTTSAVLSNFRDLLFQSMVSVGEILKPTIVSFIQDVGMPFLDWIKEAAKWFAALPAPIRQAGIAMAMLTAAAGPALIIFGQIIGGIGKLILVAESLGTALSVTGVAAGGIAGSLGLVAVAAAGLAAIGVTLYQNWDRINEVFSYGSRFINISSSDFESLASSISGIVVPAFSSLSQMILSVMEDIALFPATFEIATGGLLTLSEAFQVLRNTVSLLLSPFTMFMDGLGQLLGLTGRATGSLSMLKDAFWAALGPLGALHAATKTARLEMADFKTMTEAAGNVLRQHDTRAKQAAEAMKKEGDARVLLAKLTEEIARRRAEQQEDQKKKQQELNKFVSEYNQIIRSAAQAEEAWNKTSTKAMLERHKAFVDMKQISIDSVTQMQYGALASIQAWKDFDSQMKSIGTDTVHSLGQQAQVLYTTWKKALSSTLGEQADWYDATKKTLDKLQQLHKKTGVSVSSGWSKEFDTMERELRDALKKMESDSSNSARRMADITHSLGLKTRDEMQESLRRHKSSLDEFLRNEDVSADKRLDLWIEYYRELVEYDKLYNQARLGEDQRVLDELENKQRASSERNKGIWTDWSRQVSTIVTDLSRNISDALFDGDKSWGEKMKTILEDIGKAFVRAFIEKGLQSIQELISKKGLGGLVDVLTNIGGLIGKIFGGGNGASGALDTWQNVGGAAGGINIPGIGGATSGAASAVGGILGTLGSIGSIVGGIGSLASAVMAPFLQRGANKIAMNTQTAVEAIYIRIVDFIHPLLHSINTYIMSIHNNQMPLVISALTSIASQPRGQVTINVSGTDPQQVTNLVMQQLQLQGYVVR